LHPERTGVNIADTSVREGDMTMDIGSIRFTWMDADEPRRPIQTIIFAI
jgi:hypothetical protein